MSEKLFTPNMHTASIQVPVEPGPPAKLSSRIASIDLLRGLVMIVMALDHTRDFFHRSAFTDDPLNLQTTTPALFFTRFITHYCAPIFVFLAGTSAWLQGQRKSKQELSGFLVKRGLWLVLVEVVIMTFGIFFDPGFHLIMLQTIWAIGISMICLGAALYLPFRAIFALGALIVLGHNALDFYQAQHQGAYSPAYHFLHLPGGFPLGTDRFVFFAYPVLPWIGLMMMGYCFGRLFTTLPDKGRNRTLLLGGASLLLLFAALRATNAYGDPADWSGQKSALYTFFSFINVTKYPPSLLFMCVTIGPALLFLALTGNARGRLSRIITVYGSVPFFYYVLHFYILHTVSALFFLARGHSVAEGMAVTNAPKFLPPGEGYDLPVVYAVWAATVIALYPLCRWFSNYKRTHRQWWLSYL
ncbi:DUF1624 domain-containing protein [Flaviaesturariibacter amylovorans]|uniref:DUF1624 domain-containing protein n=1 Tax=Flaviaesturariibacter amylovorans TaxID=1084520 RepID=A0ABP8GLT3_9BACT